MTGDLLLTETLPAGLHVEVATSAARCRRRLRLAAIPRAHLERGRKARRGHGAGRPPLPGRPHAARRRQQVRGQTGRRALELGAYAWEGKTAEAPARAPRRRPRLTPIGRSSRLQRRPRRASPRRRRPRATSASRSRTIRSTGAVATGISARIDPAAGSTAAAISTRSSATTSTRSPMACSCAPPTTSISAPRRSQIRHGSLTRSITGEGSRLRRAAYQLRAESTPSRAGRWIAKVEQCQGICAGRVLRFFEVYTKGRTPSALTLRGR